MHFHAMLVITEVMAVVRVGMRGQVFGAGCDAQLHRVRHVVGGDCLEKNALENPSRRKVRDIRLNQITFEQKDSPS